MFNKIKSIFVRQGYSAFNAEFSIGIIVLLIYLSHTFYPVLLKQFPFLPINFFSAGDQGLISSFIEWFGVLYGLLIPLILVKVWEQFDTIDREFDREADTIRMLFEDVQLMRKSHSNIKAEILVNLFKYVDHVINNYALEVEDKDLKFTGDLILRNIRKLYILLVNQKAKEQDSLISELLNQLNNLVDIRGDRIALSKQRIYQSLKSIALITSAIWVIPFYFLNFTFGFIGYLLLFGVTVLVVFILSIIDDLDEPFYGKWKIGIESWFDIQKELKKQLEELGVIVIESIV